MFRKYNSIDNHYQTKVIMRWLSQFPELADEEFILEEKVDGANIQIYKDGDGKVHVGKRTQFLDAEDNFFDIWNLLSGPYHQVYNFVKDYPCNDIRLYGEVYGSGVQKRINYDTNGEKNLVFFDMMIDGQYITPEYLHTFFTPFFPIIKTVSNVRGLNNALEHNREFKSNYSDDNAEGFVIKPWKKNYIWDDSRFVLKAKSDKFTEKMKVTVKERKDLPENVLKAFTTFQGYVTDNRLENIMGNYGPIERPQQIGQYIKYMLEDMKKDFIADGFDENDFEPEELKKIYNVGHKIVTLLKARL